MDTKGTSMSRSDMVNFTAVVKKEMKRLAVPTQIARSSDTRLLTSLMGYCFNQGLRANPSLSG